MHGRQAAFFTCLILTLLGAAGLGGAASRNVVVAPGTPQLDGALTDGAWESAGWYDLTEKTSRVETGAFKGFAGSFALLYDAEHIYFAFRAVDDKLIGTRSGADIWQDDAVEVWFNWQDARNAGEPGYYQVGLAPASATGKPAVWVWRTAPGADAAAMQGIELAARPAADGWTLEARMQRSAFAGAEPLPINATLNVSVVDRDVPGDGGDANWNHITWNGTEHLDPNQFVRLEFQ